MRKILNYKIFQLNDVAGDFLQNRLKISTPLSDLIKSETNFNSGKIFTFFPDYIDENNLRSLKEGGMLKIDTSGIKYTNGMKMVPVPNTSDGLVEYIFEYLSKKNNNIVLIENFLADPINRYIQDLDYKKVIVKKHVYYWFSSEDDRKTVLKGIRECSSFPEALGIFSDISNLDSDSLGETFLMNAVKNIRALFLEAYDHEGYIIWKKTTI